MHKLSRIGRYRIFRVLNFREFGQISRNSRKFLFAKVSAPKVTRFNCVSFSQWAHHGQTTLKLRCINVMYLETTLFQRSLTIIFPVGFLEFYTFILYNYVDINKDKIENLYKTNIFDFLFKTLYYIIIQSHIDNQLIYICIFTFI